MLSRKYLFLSCLLILCITSPLPAFGRKEKTSEISVTQILPTTDSQGEVSKVLAEGLVRLVGNANFPELIISGSGIVWVIASDEREKLLHLQYRTVKIEGEETIIELKFNNGDSAGIRRELKNIKIIQVME